MEAQLEQRHSATGKVAREDRLDSWKEIAAYFNRGLRTVQRWEREEGLPVRRQLHGTSGSVYALKPELEAWRSGRDLAPAPAPDGELLPDARPAPAPVPPTSRRRMRRTWWRPAGLLVLAAAALTLRGPSSASVETSSRRVVVVPFRNLTGDPSADLISHGLTEETVTQMARLDLRRFAVVSSLAPTASAYATSAGHPVDGYLLEGSVRRVGNRLRVAARLLRETDRTLRWAETYERSVTDGTVQAELGRSITAAVLATLAR